VGRYSLRSEVVLADLRRGVAQRLEQFGDGRIRILQPLLGGGHADLQQPCAERSLAGDERSTPRCTGLLTVVVSEQRTLASDPVDVGRRTAHHAAMVSAQIPGAHVVGHDHDDIRLLLVCHYPRSFTQMIGRMVQARRRRYADTARPA
jgi:hypothetical protein